MKEKSPIPIFVLMISLCMGVSGYVVRHDATDLELPAVLECLTSWAQPQATQSRLQVEPNARAATVDVLDYGVACRAILTSFLKIASTEIPLAECLLAATTQNVGTNEGTEISLAPRAWCLPLVYPLAAEYLVGVTSQSPLSKTFPEAAVPPDEIYARAVPENKGLQGSFPGRAAPEGSTLLKSGGTTWMCGAVATVLVILGLVMIGRAPSTPPSPRYGSNCGLRVSWDFPFRGFKTFSMEDQSSQITIGQSKLDSIYSPELLAGHVGIGVEDDLLTLTCRGPVLLADGTVLEPATSTPMVRQFQKSEAVRFVAGESGFVVDRVSNA